MKNQFKFNAYSEYAEDREVMVEAKDLGDAIDEHEQWWSIEAIEYFTISVWTNQGEGRWMTMTNNTAYAWADVMIGDM